MRPHRATEAHQTDGLAELVCSNSFRSDDAAGNAVGVLHREMRATGLADHALRRRAPGAGRRRAGGGPRRLLPQAVTARDRSPAADHDRPGGSRAACRLPTGTMSSSPPGPSPRRPWPRPSAKLTGEERTGLFRRHRPHRPSRIIDMDMAWFQSRYDKAGPGGTRRRLHQLPDGPRPVRGVHRRPAAGREDRVQGLGTDALFRRLPADRGDGRARARDACATDR